MNPALPYALLAQKAYQLPPHIGAEASAARAIIETMPDGLTVAFPGTNNIACWLADLDVALTYVRGLGRLHAGFWGAYASIEGPLMEQSPKVTTGHSEGADLALLYGGALCLAGKPPKAIYAFEPARVSVDATLAKLFAQHGVKLLLTQNGEDVVPMVPRLLHAWQHPAELVKIGAASEPIPNIEDHLIENVIKALQA